MELVVGASEATMKSVMGKLGGLLAAEYTLIRGVNGDLQYINDELATMQSFLRELGTVGRGGSGGYGHGPLMKDWMKQIRDITYDIEDCIDDSGQRLHGLRTDMCCYLLVNSVYEVLTWRPRRDLAIKISILKMRAQQIGERRNRYGVNNPEIDRTSTKEPRAGPNPSTAGFNAADNQDSSLQLVSLKSPVGVQEDMEKLEKWVTNKDSKGGVLSIVGFGGVGKTTIATALYRKLGDQFDCRAMVTVSQSSDINAILTNIKNQVMPQSNSQKQQGGLPENGLTAAIKGVSRGTTALMAVCCSAGTSEETRDNMKLHQLKKNLNDHFEENSYLILIDDVWSTTTWDQIRNSIPQSKNYGRIIVTTRFEAVATTCKREESDMVHKICALGGRKSEELFKQAFSESKGTEVDIIPEKIWRICGGLQLAVVTIAGHVACNPRKPEKEWLQVCDSLVADSGKDLTQEELVRIVSHCYDNMPAEIQTCSLYLCIFPKGHKISRKRLTRRWIAEGFVSEKQGLSVEDVAETYFNHLIRRKIIRPVDHSSNGKVKNCVVHDMVLEHIVAKASEENFITVVGGHWLMHIPSSKVRRLSLQGSDSRHGRDAEKMNLSHVRSLTMFGSLNQLPSHSFKFGIVQVLDLEGCMGFKQHHTNEICKMILLRYLSLRGTDIKQLPRAIGKLENLETLDTRETNVVELPKAVCQLERLVNILGGDKRTRKSLKLPEEMNKKKKMKALRVLSGIEIVDGSADFHHLTELRKLAIYKLSTMGDNVACKELSSSIQYLGSYSLHTLIIVDESSEFLNSLDALSTPPKFLVALELSGKMAKLPGWIKQLSALNKLTLSVTALGTNNLKDLSNLEALFSLTFSFRAEQKDQQTQTILAENKLYPVGEVTVQRGGFKSLKLTVQRGGFKSLKLLRFSAPLVPLMRFSKKAMPVLERLELRFSMMKGLFGVENLAGLQEVHLKLDDKDGEDMTKKIRSEIENAVKKIGVRKPRIILDL